MTSKGIDLETIDQFLKDVGPAAPELVGLFINETRTLLDHMDQLASDRNWQKVADEAHKLKSSARTYGLSDLANVAGQLEQACTDDSAQDPAYFMRILQGNSVAALNALLDLIKEKFKI